jgi:hypothetical protein
MTIAKSNSGSTETVEKIEIARHYCPGRAVNSACNALGMVRSNVMQPLK